MKPGDEDRMSRDEFDQRHAWIVFRRRLRRGLLDQVRREMRQPEAASRVIAADRTLCPLPLRSDDSHG